MTAKNPNDSSTEKVVDFRSHSTRTDTQNRHVDPTKADEYRRTGQCDDPKLKQVAKLFHADKVVLAPERAKRLVQALIQAVEGVEQSAYSLGDILQVLEIYLPQQPDNSMKAIAEIKQQLEFDQKNLEQAIYRLLNLAKKYAQPATGKISSEQKANDLRYQKLMNDIEYIRRFLVEQVHVSVVVFERSPYPTAFLRRGLNYLDVLPGYCGELANRTRCNIFDRVPGTQSDDLDLQ